MPGIDLHTRLGAADWIATDAAKLHRALQRARFDAMGVVSLRALAGDLATGNAEVKAVVDAVPQMRGWVVVNPAHPLRSAEELRKYVGSAKWLGATLHAGVAGESVSSASAQEIVNAYRRYGKPLLVDVHNVEAIEQLEELATEFNQMKFVAAGAGGDDWQECALLAKRVVNIYLEPFSGGAHRGKLEAIVEVVGPNRIVFASGFPQQNPGSALGLLVDAKLSDAEKQGILTTNAMRLFGLTRGEPG